MLPNHKATVSIYTKYSRLPKPTKIDDIKVLGLIFMTTQSMAYYSFKPRTILVCSAGR